MAINEQDKITVPFASSGLRNDIPETATGSNLASMQEGFPAVTMTDIASGGQPPDGKDFNGILNVITKILQYAQSGGLYKYDSDYATAMGGYPVGAILRSADGSKIWLNTTANNSSDPDNGGQNWAELVNKTALATALTDYLPKSGGTVSGEIKTSSNDLASHTHESSFLRVSGGTTGQGAKFVLFGKEHATQAGQFQIASQDANGVNIWLNGRPNGELRWNNNIVLTSASTLDASKLNVSYLPTAGGTMNGDLTISRSAPTISLKETGTARADILFRNRENSVYVGLRSYPATNSVNLSALGLSGGTWEDGSRIRLEDGVLRLRASDGVTSKEAVLTKSGSFKVGNNEVLTTENGLPLSGGTMTGAIKASGDILVGANDTNYIRVDGGTDYNSGASLMISGKDLTNYNGKFVLSAYDGTVRSSLQGTPAGSLIWRGKNILREDTLCTTQPTTTSTASASNPAVVVENWRNGKEWYRKWSDGFIEQGGQIETSNGTVTLNKAFTTTDYGVNFGTYDSTSPNDAMYAAIQWRDKTTTNFKVMSAYEGALYSSIIDWTARGY